MTRPNAVVAVTVVALVFAGLASWGVYSYLHKEAERAKVAAGSMVVAASSDIPIGSKIDAAHVKMVNWPGESAPSGSFAGLNGLAGRTVVKQLNTGDIITEEKLMPRDAGPGTGIMTYIVPRGHRAVTVAVNEVAGVAGFLAPNNRVDVVLTTPIPGASNGENISKIILQDVTVLATGQVTEQREGKPNVVPTVTLDLNPEDSEKLVLASHRGSLQLLLRNVIDTAEVESKGATISRVLTGIDRPAVKQAPARRYKIIKAASPPPPSPAVSFNVELIKGKERSVKKFSE